jgi:hypothetical protein
VLLELSFVTFLPTFLMTEFTGLPNLEAAHAGAAGLPTLLVSLLPAGWACMEFLFAPSTAATQQLATAPSVTTQFDTVTSGFWQHAYWNAWGWYTVRQKELIWRAAIVGALVVAETVIATTFALQGVSLLGGLGYAALWATGVALLASVLDWVGGPTD